MNDLISRRAVMHALEKCHKQCCREDDGGDEWIHYETTVNELECIPSAQPEHCGDAVSRNAIVQKLNKMDRYVCAELRLCDTNKKFPQNEVFIVDDVYEEIVEQLPSAQPELDIWKDGTLHISVSKGQLDKIGRVLVEENGTIFCKLFYQDAESERKTGRWIPTVSGKGRHECSRCHEYAPCYQDGSEHLSTFCVLCGAKMEEGK